MSLTPYQENRPWGLFREFTKNEKSTVKIITVNPNEELSLQTHKNRDEFWHIISGSGFITRGVDRIKTNPGDEFFIPRTTEHRISASTEGIKILEIATGDFDENDITRLSDRYGR
jgi:mannose-1-phosphate guanylyltransferase/mannose-1-phosphate guanylyltransferase/mannose-6-phosphate isomerase